MKIIANHIVCFVLFSLLPLFTLIIIIKIVTIRFSLTCILTTGQARRISSNTAVQLKLHVCATAGPRPYSRATSQSLVVFSI